MKASDIKLGDWQRILVGNVSPLFLIEVFFRTLIVYLFLLTVVRLLGKRMSGQLTIMEMTVMITLGAIVSIPMQTPQSGILQGLLILVLALLIHRGINYLGFFNPELEKVVQGEPTVLVKNGVLQLKEMTDVRVTRQQLFAELRSKKIVQLGSLKRVYLEPAGFFSIIKAKKESPGLSVYPEIDHSILKSIKLAEPVRMVCTNCGTLNRDQHFGKCENCQQENYINAIG